MAVLGIVTGGIEGSCGYGEYDLWDQDIHSYSLTAIFVSSLTIKTGSVDIASGNSIWILSIKQKIVHLRRISY